MATLPALLPRRQGPWTGEPRDMALQHQGRGARRVGQEAFNYYIRGPHKHDTVLRLAELDRKGQRGLVGRKGER